MTDAPFKKKAKDGDDDGIVQDGTPFERPDSVKGNPNKTALYCNRNIYWNQVGRLKKGYNIVNDIHVDKWLSLKGVRVATPAEVAKEYGV